MTAVLNADVVGYSRMMGEDEAATVRTLETYKGVMFALIRKGATFHVDLSFHYLDDGCNGGLESIPG